MELFSIQISLLSLLFMISWIHIICHFWIYLKIKHMWIIGDKQYPSVLCMYILWQTVTGYGVTYSYLFYISLGICRDRCIVGKHCGQCGYIPWGQSYSSLYFNSVSRLGQLCQCPHILDLEKQQRQNWLSRYDYIVRFSALFFLLLDVGKNGLLNELVVLRHMYCESSFAHFFVWMQVRFVMPKTV